MAPRIIDPFLSIIDEDVDILFYNQRIELLGDDDDDFNVDSDATEPRPLVFV